MSESKLRFKSLHPLVQVLLLGTVVVNTVQAMCAPFFAVFLMKHTDVSVAAIGAMMGMGALSGTIGGFLGGTLSDRFGRTKVMLGSLMVQAIVYAGYSFVRHPSVLLVLIVLSGFLGAFFGPTSKAMIADVTPARWRVSVFAWQYFGTNIGYAVGPLLAVALGVVGGAGPFLLMAVVYVFYTLTLVFYVIKYPVQHTDESLAERKSLVESLRVLRTDKILFLFIVGGFLTTLVHGQWSTPMSVLLTNDFKDGQNILSALLTTNAVTVIVVQPLLSKRMRRWPPLRNIVIGGVLMAIGSVMFADAEGFVAFVAGMVVFTVGEVLIVPSEYAMIDQITPDALRGAYYGATSFTGLGSFVGPWLFNAMLVRWNGPAMFACMAAFALLSIFVYCFGWKSKTKPAIVPIHPSGRG